MSINYNRANERIRGWGGTVHADLIQSMASEGIVHRQNSPSRRAASKSLKDSYRENDGMINRVSYAIPKHMIYVHKGVGKGTPINKVGTNGRRAKPWFNPVIDRHINDLADIAAEEMGTAILNNLLIK